ncbi:hypothetical protein ACM66B_005688 [Microbotryomycetes sp. NB124-2]
MSGIDANNATAAIQVILKNVPPGANPFDVLRAALGSQVVWRVSPTFRPQMYALSGLLILAELLLVSSLVARIARGSFWLAASVRDSQGRTYLTTHYLSVWTTFMCIFLALLQGFMWTTINKSRGSEAHYIVLWETLTWIPPWLGFWFATTSLATAHIVHRDSAGRPYQSVWASAWLVNVVAWTVPILVIVLITSLAGKAQKEYDGVRYQYSQLLQLLIGAADKFNGQIDYSIIQAGMTSTQDFLDHMTTFVRFFRAVFFAYVGLTLILMVTYGLASLLHLGELSRSMQALTQSNSRDDDKAQDQLYRTYNTLVRLTILICALLALFAALFLFVAASGRKAVTDQMYLQAGHLMPGYVFSVLGLPIAILLLHRALTSNPNSNDSKRDMNNTHSSSSRYHHRSTDQLTTGTPVEVEAKSSPLYKDSMQLRDFSTAATKVYDQSSPAVKMSTPLVQYTSIPPSSPPVASPASQGYVARQSANVVATRGQNGGVETRSHRVAAEPM